MILFWTLLSVITLSVLAILIFPSRHPERCVLIALFMVVFSVTMYLKFGASSQLAEYQANQKKAAHIQAEIQALGGLDNIIRAMEERVGQNQDPEGWLLLGRLYIQAERFEDAERAFQKAKSLQEKF